MKKYLVWFFAMGLLLAGCSNDDDDGVTTTEEQVEEEETTVNLVADFPVQDFMWIAMNRWYFWQADVENLADTKDDIENDYADFLASEENPEDFFFRRLANQHVRVVGDAAAIDRFSFLNEDFRVITQGSAGISKSNGVEFGLSLFGEGNDVFGWVRYIVADSDASGKDISRGDIFTRVDGVNLNADNFGELLFGDNDTYTLGFADIVDNAIVPNSRELSLTKEENLLENPILVNRVIERGGLRIGYLMYNSFVANFDEELNEVFNNFKSQNVDELILDFRYNGGGRVSSAIQIASSVYGTRTDQVFLTPRFNPKRQEANGIPDNFVDQTINGSAINSLELNRVYIITSSSTASASELVINGLEPYIDVQQIGTATVGKNEFSVTFVDDPDGGFFYNPDREANINPDNQWAIQPLLGRNENADGFSDYTAGLLPDVELREDITNLGVLGENSDPLLALTLNTIDGSSARANFQVVMPADIISSSAIMKPLNNQSLMDGLIKHIE